MKAIMRQWNCAGLPACASLFRAGARALATLLAATGLAATLLHGGAAIANAPGLNITVSPNPGIYPITRVGSFADADFTVTNISASTLTVTGLDTGSSNTFTIPALAAFVSSCNFGTQLLPGDSCIFTVRFTPAAPGNDMAVLTVGVDAPDSMTVNLSGVGGTMTASVSPTTANFPDTPQGVIATPIDLTVTNTGSMSISFASTFSQVDVFQDSTFPISGTCEDGIIAPGNSCTIRVGFQPTLMSALGAHSYNLDAFLNGATGWGQTTFTSGPINAMGNVLPPSPLFSAAPPSNVVFSTQTVATTSAAQQVTVSNTGSLVMTISSIMSPDPDYGVTNNCPMSPSTLGLGQSCTVFITFTPSVVGTDNGVLSITTDAPGSPHLFNLFGTGGSAGAPAYSGSASTFTFAARTVGSASPAQTLTVTNTGSVAMTISSIMTNLGDYTLGGNCPTSLGAGLSCVVNITFTPAAVGSRPAILTISTNAAGSPHNISLAGSGLAAAAPGVTLNPSSLNFGVQGVGTTSASQRSVLTNNGTTALTIQSITTLGDFAFVSNCPLAPATLGAGGTCNIDVTFSPLVAGLEGAAVLINDNAPGGPHSLPLSGQGLLVQVPAISVSPAATLAFADRVIGSISPVQTLTVSNTGQASLNLSGIVVSGSAFQRVTATPASSDCGAVVAPQASCLIALVFAPNAAGALSGSVVIRHNAATATVTITLSGNGTPVPQPLIRLSAALAFGDQIIATTSAAQVVTITNGGTAPMVVSAVTLGGANVADFATTGNCVTTIAPNAGCSINVTFAPAALGARAAAINVTSNAQNATGNSSLNLSGNGVPVPKPVVRLSATTLGFGNVIYGGTPGAQAFTLGNIGTAPLVIQGITTSGNSDFTQTNTCGTGLAAQAQCTISLRFAPHALGARSGTVTIRSNADGSPHNVQMGGSGCRYFSPAAARFFLTSC